MSFVQALRLSSMASRIFRHSYTVSGDELCFPMIDLRRRECFGIPPFLGFLKFEDFSVPIQMALVRVSL